MTRPVKTDLDPLPMNKKIMALLDKMGMGAIGFILLGVVYFDNRNTTKSLIEEMHNSSASTKATAEAVSKMADQLHETHDRTDEMRSVVSKIATNVEILASKQNTN